MLEATGSKRAQTASSPVVIPQMASEGRARLGSNDKCSYRAQRTAGRGTLPGVAAYIELYISSTVDHVKRTAVPTLRIGTRTFILVGLQRCHIYSRKAKKLEAFV